MSSQTRTRIESASTTSTLTKVVYVTRKVQADLFNLVDTYGQISQDYATTLIHDLRILLDEEVLDRIEFVWTYKNTDVVIGAYVYKVITAEYGLVDDRAGGIRYDAMLQNADFGVRITRNERWRTMSAAGKKAINDQCDIGWVPASALDYSRGTLTSERMFSNGDLGLDRLGFKRY